MNAIFIIHILIIIFSISGASSSTNVYGFGYNLYGQLGLNGTQSISFPVMVTSLSPLDIVKACGGESHSLALSREGNVYAFGGNDYGQLGLGDNDQRNEPTLITELTSIISISCGSVHSLALTSNGQVYSFGRNNHGQLGLNDTSDRISPELIASLSSIEAISANGFHSLALTNSGEVYSFGRNTYGQLGLNDTEYRTEPTLISLLSHVNIKSVNCGYHHSMVITNDGRVYSFGENSHGQLGLGDVLDRSEPELIISLPPIESIAASFSHSLVLTNDSRVFSMGSNSHGQLGLNSSFTSALTPEEIPNLHSIRSIGAGIAHSLVLSSDGRAYSFGWNIYGQLGLNDSSSLDTQYAPKLIETLSAIDLTYIAAGEYHSFVLVDNSAVVTTGSDSTASSSTGEGAGTTGSVTSTTSSDSSGTSTGLPNSTTSDQITTGEISGNASTPNSDNTSSATLMQISSMLVIATTSIAFIC